MKARGRLFAAGTIVLGILVLTVAAVGSGAAVWEKIADLYQSWRLGSKPVVVFYEVGDFTYGAYPPSTITLFRYDEPDPEVRRRKILSSDLIDLLKNEIREADGTSSLSAEYTYRRGHLSVKTTYRNHVRVRKRLAQVRAERGVAPPSVRPTSDFRPPTSDDLDIRLHDADPRIVVEELPHLLHHRVHEAPVVSDGGDP